MTKEVRIEEFDHLFEAMYWLENLLYELEVEHDNFKAEVSIINGKYRVGVILDGGQLEFKI